MHTLFAALIESGQAAGELRTDLSAAQLAQHLQLLYLGALTAGWPIPRQPEAQFDAVVSLFTQGAGAPSALTLDWAAAADAGPRWPAAGRQLAMMARMGVPVPDGFVLSAQANRERAADGDLSPSARQAAPGAGARGWLDCRWRYARPRLRRIRRARPLPASTCPA